MGNNELVFTYRGHGAERRVRLSEIKEALNQEELYVLNIRQKGEARIHHIRYHRVNPKKIEEVLLSIDGALLENTSIFVFPSNSIWH